jgi:hypothetical protein
MSTCGRGQRLEHAMVVGVLLLGRRSQRFGLAVVPFQPLSPWPHPTGSSLSCSPTPAPSLSCPRLSPLLAPNPQSLRGDPAAGGATHPEPRL